jgi:hypothetical protein
MLEWADSGVVSLDGTDASFLSTYKGWIFRKTFHLNHDDRNQIKEFLRFFAIFLKRQGTLGWVCRFGRTREYFPEILLAGLSWAAKRLARPEVFKIRQGRPWRTRPETSAGRVR